MKSINSAKFEQLSTRDTHTHASRLLLNIPSLEIDRPNNYLVKLI
jgi:hypothetical protein